MEHYNSDYYADDATVHTHGNIPTEIEAKLHHNSNNTKLTIETTFHIYPNLSPKMFYQGFILPLTCYGSSSSGTTSKGTIERLS